MKNLIKILILLTILFSCTKDSFNYPKAFNELVCLETKVLSYTNSEIVLENRFMLMHPSSESQTIDKVNSFRNLQKEDITLKVPSRYDAEIFDYIYDEDYSATVEELEYIEPLNTEPVYIVFMMHPALKIYMINAFMSNFNSENEYLFSFFYRKPGQELLDFTNNKEFSNCRDEKILNEIIRKQDELKLLHEDYVPLYDALNQMLEFFNQIPGNKVKNIVVTTTGTDDSSSVTLEQVISKARQYNISISFYYRIGLLNDMLIPMGTNGSYSYFVYQGQIDNGYSIPIYYFSDLFQNKYGYYKIKLRLTDNLSRFEANSFQRWHFTVNCLRNPQDYENGIAINQYYNLVFELK